MSLIKFTNNGIEAINRNEILQYLIQQFKIVYGQNVYVSEGTEDYNMLAALADIFNDMGMIAVSTSQGLNLQTATGTQLDNISTIFYNTITRTPATFSTVSLTINGIEGTIITNGQVKDASGGIWNLPQTVVIPNGGTTNVVATYNESGAYYIEIGQINGASAILTPVSGWNNVNNAVASTVGSNIENDTHFRYRLAVKAQGLSKSVLNTLYTNLTSNVNLPYAMIWENDTASLSQAQGGTIQNIPDFTNASLYSVAPHSVCISVYGDFNNITNNEIGNLIFDYKGTGVGTFAPTGGSGTTSVIIENELGVLQPINFVKASAQSVNVNVSLQKLSILSPDLSDTLITEIQSEISSKIQDKNIGSLLLAGNLYLPVSEAINKIVGSNVYNITEINFGTNIDMVQMTYYQKPIPGTINVEIVTI